MSVVSLLSPGVPTLRLDGSGVELHRILTSLSGWIGSPDAKVQLSEREGGDGAHDIPVDDIRYSSRAVSVGFRFKAGSDSRDFVLSLLDELKVMLHRAVTVRVDDGLRRTYCTGYVSQLTVDQKQQLVDDQTLSGTVDIVCPRPEILSVDARSWQLGAKPLAATQGEGVGLRYSPAPSKSGTMGLSYPLRYAEGAIPNAGNTATLINHGTSRAYPIFVCNGPLPHGVRLTFGGLQEPLVCEQPVYGVPLVLDCRSRSAEVGGLDVSRTLTSRGFPTVPPGGSLPVTLSADGTGWVDAMVRDTYM